MTAIRLAVAAAIAAACGMGTALAQSVPARVQGLYAIGNCLAPEVLVTIDGNGLEVHDGETDELISSVVVQDARDLGGRIEMSVLVDGTSGTVALVDATGGAIDVIYTGPSGVQEAPQRLELCLADFDDAPEPPVADLRVPDVLLGEFATGSCATPDERLVIEATRLEAFTGSRSEGVAQLRGVSEIPGGYALEIDLDGALGTLEMTMINQDIIEVVFVLQAGGGSQSPETLFRCTPLVVSDEPVIDEPVIDEPVIDDLVIDEPVVDEPVPPVATTLPEAYLGRYALGDGASCETASVLVDFEPDRMVVYDDGRIETVISVEAVTATSPDLEFVANSGGKLGDVVMQSIGGDRFRIVFTDRESGRVDDSETLTLCTPAVPGEDGPSGPTADIGSFIFTEPAARFGALMTQLETTCMPGSEQACLDLFWSFADVTGDGQLTGPELARVIRYAMKWGVSENVPFLRLGQQVSVHLGTMVSAPLIANGLIYNHDYDGNNALSQIELFPDGVASAPLAVPALMQLISESTLEDIFESLEELERM